MANPRVQKLLAQAGAGSRRGMEKRIAEGDVCINGRPAELGATLKEGDIVQMDKKSWEVESDRSPPRVLMYFKPEGELCTRSDPHGRPTVFDKLPTIHHGRWVSIGRLDINTRGLLLLTDDGDLANHLMHPSSNIDREYACRIHGHVTGDMMQRLRDGVELEDGKAEFSDIQPAGGEGSSNRWFHVVIMEGRNREVRRLWESQDVQVSRLKRVRYGPVFLPKNLRQGHHRELSTGDVKILCQDVRFDLSQSLSLRRLK